MTDNNLHKNLVHTSAKKENKICKVDDVTCKEQYSVCLAVVIIVFILLTLYCSPFRGAIENLFKCGVGRLGVNDQLVHCHLIDFAKYWGELIWALTASDAAFIIFYYGALNQTNYGISYRTITAYVFGSYFIPILLVGMFFMSVLTVIMLIFRMYSQFYLLSFGTLISQIMIVFCCISVTSRTICQKAVLKAEIDQYTAMRKQIAEKCIQTGQVVLWYGDLELLERNRRYHTESIMNGNETILEKTAFVEKILDIPFTNRNNTFSEIDYYAIKLYIGKNLQLVFSPRNNLIRDTERQAALSMIYNVTVDRINECSNKKTDEEERKASIELFLFLGCVFRLWVSDDSLKERWIAIDYIINNLLLHQTQMRYMSLALLLLIMDIMMQAGQTDWGKEDLGCIADKELLEKILCLEKGEKEELCTVLYVLFSGYTDIIEKEKIYRIVSQLGRTDSHSRTACIMTYLMRTDEERRHGTYISI